jgi:molybdenum cofactor synthesis domain-containing protein
MHPVSDLISLDEAIRRVVASTRRVDRREHVPVAAAAGRTLAAAVVAAEDAPAGDRSRMDGYAVACADLAGKPPFVRRVQGRALADAPSLPRLDPGCVFEVATGTLLPDGADAVVPVEDTQPGPGPSSVSLGVAPRAGAHVSPRGSDYRAGETVIESGARVTAARAAAAAAVGVADVPVLDRPRVLIVPTGDEVVPTGAALTRGLVRDSNSFGLAALVTACGGLPVRHPVVQDLPAKVADALGQVRGYDAAVFTGGTSAGAKDHLSRELASAGEVLFHGVCLRPGKPILFATVGGVPVLGLPGNPTSCMVGAHLLLRPLLGALSGHVPGTPPTTPCLLDGDLSGLLRSSPEGFTTIALVKVEAGRATPVLKDSMSVTGASLADGYIRFPPGARAPAPGAVVPVALFD